MHVKIIKSSQVVATVTVHVEQWDGYSVTEHMADSNTTTK